VPVIGSVNGKYQCSIPSLEMSLIRVAKSCMLQQLDA
jgi:hypothetical protein